MHHRDTEDTENPSLCALCASVVSYMEDTPPLAPPRDGRGVATALLCAVLIDLIKSD
jgi:hypothetical protein